MKHININLFSILAAFLIINITLSAQHDDHKKHSMEKKEVIDVREVDKNKDGKVMMCPMFCTDLVSDEAGRCPECEMKLSEYSIADAEKHLKDKGYKIKEHEMDEDHKMHEGHKMDKGHKMHEGEHGMEKSSVMDMSAVDKNKDGKVYQCPMMCTDHTSDEEGRCSKCEMRLKEYSLEDAKNNLSKSGK